FSVRSSNNKPISWKNPFDEGVKITEDMLRPLPNDIGWEDYYHNVQPKYQRRKGGNMFE
ncbi:transposase, partial [Vibrio anguillarum]|nr:transposase [Vibrio anguillarum]MBF4426488.1 transposase [Vibrio anguillarum]